jgi:adhesin transport system membrane fusion protein
MSLTNRDLWIDPSETEREGTKFFRPPAARDAHLHRRGRLVWAHYAVLDEITRGEGKVIASSQTQVIQSVKGGKIKALNVREGDIVEAGQVVAVPRQHRALHQRSGAEAAEMDLVRGACPAAGRDRRQDDPSQIVFPDDLIKEAPQVVETEKSVFIIRQQQGAVAARHPAIPGRDQAAGAAQIDTKVSTARKSLDIAQQQVDILVPMVANNIASKVELLRAQQEVQQYQSEISNAEASRPPARAALAEVQAKLKEIDATFRADAAQQMNQHRAELASVTELLSVRSSRAASRA